VIDSVPTRPGVIIATGGSGHAFKFLPIIGRFVADRVEGLESDDIMKLWRWRRLINGQKAYNELGKGSNDPRALQNVAMSSNSDLDLNDLSWKDRYSGVV
jgi:sarcosine oxidase/L-pipecolate oxidase